MDNKCTIEFDEFEFFANDFLTRHVFLRCDRLGDPYPVTKSSTIHKALLYISPSTWHQRLSHPGEDVLRYLVSRSYISCNEDKSSHIWHAC